MEPQRRLRPLYFFLSIGALITLIASVSSFLNLSFSTLDHALPDVLTATYQYGYVSYSYDGMRTALALLIIIFPVFLILSKYWLQLSKRDMSHWDEVIRKWTIYLILFLASITIIVDLVTLVRYFVSGEITLRFIIKVAIVLVTAGLAGWYFARSLQKPDDRTTGRYFAIVSSILVIVLIIWSFSIMGGPGSQRKLRLDQRRLDDLQSIQWQVINYWQQKQKLPEKLSDLVDPISNYSLPVDPEFQKGTTYEYKKLEDQPAQKGKKFELCATFSAPLPKGWIPNGGYEGTVPLGAPIARDSSVAMPYPGGMGENWSHEAGYACFERTIDPDLFPPFPKPVKQ